MIVLLRSRNVLLEDEVVDVAPGLAAHQLMLRNSWGFVNGAKIMDQLLCSHCYQAIYVHFIYD